MENLDNMIKTIMGVKVAPRGWFAAKYRAESSASVRATALFGDAPFKGVELYFEGARAKYHCIDDYPAYKKNVDAAQKAMPKKKRGPKPQANRVAALEKRVKALEDALTQPAENKKTAFWATR